MTTETTNGLEKFLQKLQEKWGDETELCAKFHQDISQIECLWAMHKTGEERELVDLGEGVTSVPSKVLNSPEDRARKFLHRLAAINLFHLDTSGARKAFAEKLFTKHVISSYLGTHCIFALRDKDNEELKDTNFIVHLDHDNSIVLLTSIYTHEHVNLFLSDEFDDITKPAPETAIKVAIEEYKEDSGVILKIDLTDKITVPNYDPENPGLVPCFQLKVTTDQGSFVWYINGDGEFQRRYRNGPMARMANIYTHIWSDKEEEVSDKPVKRVMLRELTSEYGALSGPYAKVLDFITLDWSHEKYHLFLDGNNPAFDRTMAYYHLDLIQRYFRNLGLEMLADDNNLNPLHVVLRKNAETHFNTNDSVIIIGSIADTLYTQAREAKVIYHEYVHAVTDSLARLHRQDDNNAKHPRRVQIYQAMAMDEGLADYFACSLAQKYGASESLTFGLLEAGEDTVEINKQKLKLSQNRDLNPKCGFKSIFDITEEDLKEQLAATDGSQPQYKWGERWGRYLWGLRDELKDDEVADRIIAHSIICLTRWSSFEYGVVAIMIADQLLYDSENHYNQIVKDTPLADIPLFSLDGVSEGELPGCVVRVTLGNSD